MVRAAAVMAGVVGIVAVLAGCATSRAQAPSLAEDEAAIAAFNARYVKAINDGDLATLSSLTTDEHIMLPPGRPPLVGKQANDAANSRVFQQFNVDESWTPLETVVTGDWAYQRGMFNIVTKPKAGGDARTTRGNFLRIYRRQPDGAWRMTRDMFNIEQPAPAN